MVALTDRKIPSGPAFEVKGTIAPVTVLCLRSTELDRIEAELRARVEPAPQMFLNAPIVIDVADIEGELGSLSLPGLVERLRRCKLIPIGVAHLPADQAVLAAEHGLAVVQLGFGRTRGARANSPSLSMPEPAAPPQPAAQPPLTQAAQQRAAQQQAAQQKAAHEQAAQHEAAPPPQAKAAAAEQLPTVTIGSAVRSGQVVYAQRTDLVVMAAVNPGAQVIADGHIHIYGRLMGRALAGAHGQADARVFCQSLEAELVSVGGEFLTADDIPEKLRGKPAQIFVEHGAVRVAPL